MVQLNGFVSSVNHFSSRAHEKNLSACLYILICSFIVSANIYRRQFLCRTLEIKRCTKHSPKTQYICSLVDRQSRLWLDWVPCFLAWGCRRHKMSWIHELLIYVILTPYKIHIFYLLENVIKGLQTIPLKRIIVLANIYQGQLPYWIASGPYLHPQQPYTGDPLTPISQIKKDFGLREVQLFA